MRGTVKFFDKIKGWGFITDPVGKDFFVYWENIVMDGFRHLDKNDIVNFELGQGNDGREQAISVIPVLSMKMIKDCLKKDNLYVHDRNIKDVYGQNTYMVIDQNNVIQSSEDGMSFLELAAYAGFDVRQVSD